MLVYGMNTFDKVVLIYKGLLGFGFLAYLLDNLVWFNILGVNPPVWAIVGSMIFGATVGIWAAVTDIQKHSCKLPRK